MSNKEDARANKETSPLSTLTTMLGSGESFFVGKKKYTVKPLKLKDVAEFSEDGVNIGPQMYSVINQELKDKLDKWMARQVFDANDEPMSLQKAIDDDWDLIDLRRCVQMMIDISG